MSLGKLSVLPITSCKFYSDCDLHRTRRLPSLKAHCWLFWYRWPPMLPSWCLPVRLRPETPAALWKRSPMARSFFAILTGIVNGDSWIAILWVKVCAMNKKTALNLVTTLQGPKQNIASTTVLTGAVWFSKVYNVFVPFIISLNNWYNIPALILHFSIGHISMRSVGEHST